MSMFSARNIVTIIVMLDLSQITENVYTVPKPTVTQVYDTAVQVEWGMRPSMRFHEFVYSFQLEKRSTTDNRWETIDSTFYFHFYLEIYYVTGLTLGNTYDFRLKIIKNKNFHGIAESSDISTKWKMVQMAGNVANKLFSKPTNVESTYVGENSDFAAKGGYVANITWQFTSSEIIKGFRVIINPKTHNTKIIAAFVDKTQRYCLLKTRESADFYRIQVQTFNYKTVGPVTNMIIQCGPRKFGNTCNKTCHCTSTATCSSLTGVCSDGTCGRGWTSLKPTENNCQTQCVTGFHGENCQETCGKCDNKKACNAVNGECQSCEVNFLPPYCKECVTGYYGKTCNKRCGKCKNNQTCNSTDGYCLSCVVNFQPPLCQDCVEGYYGKACNKKCGACKNNEACNSTNGLCLNCALYFQPPFCQDCVAGYYEKTCSKRCGACKNNQTCNSTNGYCLSCLLNFQPPFCQDCVSGYYGALCKHNCNCFRNYFCDRITGSCGQFGCAFSWSGKNKCNEKHGCSKGFYGRLCLRCGHCSVSCATFNGDCLPDCNQTTGDCLTKKCQPNFTGRRCDRCALSRYGLKCQHKCSHCLKDVCNEFNGLCRLGCKNGYMGFKCDLPCKPGLYGHKCRLTCGQCALEMPCDFTTGDCPESCESGYKGKKCDEIDMPACSSGHFGKYCERLCGTCLNGAICNNTNGVCPTGCVGRYIPPLCLTCQYNHFGPECDQTCGYCKLNVTCDSYTGACPLGCARDFTGPHCKRKKLAEAKTNDDSFHF